MKIIVKAKPNAKEEKVKKMSQPTLGFEALRQAQDKEEIYEVSVKEPPINGRANAAIARALAEHFGIAPSLVRLISGQTSKRKVFELR